MRRFRSQSLFVAFTLTYLGALLVGLGAITYFPAADVILLVGQSVLTAGFVAIYLAWSTGRRDRQQERLSLPVFDLKNAGALERLRDEMVRSKRVRLALSPMYSRFSAANVLVDLVGDGLVQAGDVAVLIDEAKPDPEDAISYVLKQLEVHKIPIRVSSRSLQNSIILTEDMIYVGVPIGLAEGTANVGSSVMLEIPRYSQLGRTVEDSFADVWAGSHALRQG